MRKKNIILLPVSIFLILFFVLRCTILTKPKNIKVTIVYTDQLRGNIKPLDGDGEYKGKKMGGFVFIASAIKKIRNEVEKEGGHFLLLDTGNFLFGTPEAYYTKGEAVIDLMNQMGYTATILGDLDFNIGLSQIRNYSQRSSFTFLGANIIDNQTGKTSEIVKPYTIVNIGKMKVGIIGLTDCETSIKTASQNLQGLTIPYNKLILEQTINDITNYTDLFKNEKVGFTILLTNSEIAKGILNISHSSEDIRAKDILKIYGEKVNIVIGKSNPLLKPNPYPFDDDSFLVNLNSHSGQEIGRIDLLFKSKTFKLLSYSHQIIPIFSDQITPDANLAKLLGEYEIRVDKILNEVIGETLTELPAPHIVGTETAMSFLITDIILNETKADLVIYNAGAMRATIPKGKITNRLLYSALPFDNWIVVMKLKGKFIQQVMELAIEKALTYKGTKVVTAGLTCKYNPNLPSQPRVKDILIQGEKIDPEKEYIVATNDYLAGEGSGYYMFKEGTERKDVIYVRPLVTDYIKSHSPISVRPQKRIIKVEN